MVTLPDDGPLGLAHGALRGWTVVLLAVCGAAALLVAVGGLPSRRSHRLPPWLTVAAVALLLRAAVSLVQDGHIYDVLVAYRLVGENFIHGSDIWTGHTASMATYPPPVYGWWGIASLIPTDHPHLFAALVRAPFWIADAAIAVVLLRAVGGEAGRRAAWVYALCPVAIAVPTLHGQLDPVADLLLLVAVIVLVRRPLAAGLATGAAIAVKQFPAFFLLPLLAALPRRLWPRLGIGLFLLPVAGFAVYGLWRPADAVQGAVDVATYASHRDGLGTSLAFPAYVPAGVIIVSSALAVLLGGVLGVVAVRRGRSIAEAMAFNMLIVVALSPTVSDQYLMWAFPFLLLAGRVRTAALLAIGLLPATLSLDLWSSQNLGPTPRLVLGLSTICVLAAAASLVRGPRRPVLEAAQSSVAVSAAA